ncbi:MAG: autotransporter outer membrane beta-barrel domain-containing protein, partial [Akkermansia sp.]
SYTRNSTPADDLIHYVGDSFLINGTEYNSSDYLHWDEEEGILSLFFDEGMPNPAPAPAEPDEPTTLRRLATENSLLSTASALRRMGNSALHHMGSAKLLAAACRRITPVAENDGKGHRLPTEPLPHEAWVEALGESSGARRRGGALGYRFTGAGAAAGVDAALPNHCELGRWGVAVGRLHGHNRARGADEKTEQDTTMLALYWGKAVPSSPRHAWLMRGALSYGQTENCLHRREGADAHGEFDNRAWNAQGELADQHLLSESLRLSLVLAVEYDNARRESFEESGAGARRCEAARLERLSLLPGLELEHESRPGSMSWVNSLRLSYVGDVCRKLPRAGAVTLDSGELWDVRSVESSRHGVRGSLQSRLQLNERWALYADYSIEGRSRSLLQQLSIGASCAF